MAMLLEFLDESRATTISVVRLLWQSAIGEMPKAAGEQVLRRKPADPLFIGRDLMKRIDGNLAPGDIDDWHALRLQLPGQRPMGDAGDDAVPPPVARD